MHSAARWLSNVLLVGALAGCQTSERVVTSRASLGVGCDLWGCGTNSAWLGEGVVFHDEYGLAHIHHSSEGIVTARLKSEFQTSVVRLQVRSRSVPV